MHVAIVTLESDGRRDAASVTTSLTRITSWASGAAALGADVVLFPEFSIGHYHGTPVPLDGPEVAEVSR